MTNESHIDSENAADLMDEMMGRTKSAKVAKINKDIEETKASGLAGASQIANTGPASTPAKIVDASAGTTTPSKYPNPLGYDLTQCHLPKHFITHREAMLKYVGENVAKNIEGKVSPSPNESELYREYVKLCGRANQRPLIPRTFVAAVRLIALGKPIDPAAERTVDKFHL